MSAIGSTKSAQYQIDAKAKRIAEYNLNPTRCVNCNTAISYDRRRNKNCSLSCSSKSSSNLTSVNDSREIDIVESNCANCGINIRDNRSRNRKFCSNVCQGAHTRSVSNQRVLDGVAPAAQVKRYILETRGHRCEYCKATTHNSKSTEFKCLPITLELEHIDGNASNNKLENCVVICPTCHSFTSTFKAKNKGNGRAARRQRYQDGKSY